MDQALFYHRAMDAVGNQTVEILERRRKTATIHRRGWVVRRALLTADVVGLSLTFLATQAVHGLTPGELLLFVATVPFWVLGAVIYGLYARDEVHTDHTTVDDLVGVFHLVTVGSWLFFALAWLTGASVGIAELLTFWSVAVVVLTLGRSLARAWSRRQLLYLQNTVIIGAGDIGQLVARKMLQHPEYGINLVGFIDDAPRERRPEVEHLSLLGPLDRLAEIIHLFDVERVLVAFSNDSQERLVEAIRSLHRLDIQVDIVPRLFELIGPAVCTHTVEGLPLVGLPPVKQSRLSRGVKRTVDIVGASVALLIATPIFIAAALLIKRDSPGPVFFKQQRLGMNMKEFTLLKFRTMATDTDEGPHRDYVTMISDLAAAPSSNGLYKLERHADVTSVGRWLRKTSIDELPQLINVLRGEMSLVGPRPCIAYETEAFAPHHFERFSVPAGMTGLWQVTARAHSTFREALDLDVSYARGWSLGLDLSVMLRTIRQLGRHASTA